MKDCNNKIIVLWSKMPEKWRQPIRFCVVGGIATGVHYAIYWVLLLWMWAWLAYSIGYGLSFVMNYFLTNYFTFKTRPNVKNGLGFAFSHAVNYGLHILFLEFFLYVGIPAAWAPVPVFCCVIPINFLLVRLFFNKYK